MVIEGLIEERRDAYGASGKQCGIDDGCGSGSLRDCSVGCEKHLEKEESRGWLRMWLQRLQRDMSG